MKPPEPNEVIDILYAEIEKNKKEIFRIKNEFNAERHRSEVLEKLLMELPCMNPQGHDTEYVSEDMAIDAGDRSMAGSVYREAEWQRCGGCPTCIAQLEFSESDKREVEFIRQILSYEGRMIGDSETRIKNANICTDDRKLWFGDVDLKKDAKKIQQIAEGLNKKIYVLREMDARFENEKKPLLERAKAIFSPTNTNSEGSKN